MLARRRQCFCALGKMNLLQRAPPFPDRMIARQQRLHIVVAQIFQGMKQEPAEDALRKPFRCRIDRRDPAKVNREFVVVFDHLELWMFHANALTAQSRLPEDDQSLTGRDHLLHIVKIEPAEHERLAERIRIRLLQSRLENLLPAAEASHRGLRYFAADANRRVAFLPWESGELPPVFVPSRKMRQEIFDCFNPEPTQWREPGARNPVALIQPLRDFHYASDAAARRPCT